jgi:hypothetical protein
MQMCLGDLADSAGGFRSISRLDLNVGRKRASRPRQISRLKAHKVSGLLASERFAKSPEIFLSAFTWAKGFP